MENWIGPGVPDLFTPAAILYQRCSVSTPKTDPETLTWTAVDFSAYRSSSQSRPARPFWKGPLRALGRGHVFATRETFS
jgi:hypothetical protein